MTEVDFYFNAADRLQVACRLAAKALARGRRLVIYAPERELAQRIDRMLWTWPATAFVPHCLVGDALASDTPVLIAPAAGSVPAADVLLNLDADCPPEFERHARLLEVVPREEEARAAARARYARYRAAGCVLRNHDLASGEAQ